MAKVKSNRRKARSTSIYRGTERLLGDLLAISERIPKSAYGLQALGGRMVNEALEALATTEYALNEPDINRRIAYICSLIHSMTIVKSCCRQLYGYSRKECKTVDNINGEINVVNIPRYGRIVSYQQYTNLLRAFGKLSKDIGKWFRASQTIRLKMGNTNM